MNKLRPPTRAGSRWHSTCPCARITFNPTKTTATEVCIMFFSRSRQWAGTLHLALVLIAALLSTLSLADTSWPQKADGAEAAGFSQKTIDNLDAAMEKIVADQDVAGMV